MSPSFNKDIAMAGLGESSLTKWMSQLDSEKVNIVIGY